LASVAFSVTNVCGFAYFMGLTIEIVTSIILILSVGLALVVTNKLDQWFPNFFGSRTT
jgi:hypothetical protein